MQRRIKTDLVFKSILLKSPATRIYIGLILVTILSKVLGFAREVVIAYKFGVDVDLDVFLVALTIPNMIYSILLYAIPNIVVPRYSKANSDSELFSEYSKTFFWPYFIVISIIQVLYLLFSSFLIRLIAGDLSAENFAMAVNLARYFSVFIYFTAIYCAFKGIFHTKKWFIVPAIAPFFVHFFVILITLLFSDTLGVKTIVFGMGIGAVFQFLIMVYFLNKNNVLRYLTLKLEYAKNLISPFVIIILIELAGQAYTLIDRSFAAEIPKGYISALNYASILNMLPISILGITLSTILFPDFSGFIQEKRFDLLKKRFINSLLFIGLVGGLSFIILFFGAELIIRILLERGEFNENATYITSEFLKISSIGIPLIMVHTIVTKLYFSFKLEKVLLLFTCIAIIFKLITAKFFVNGGWYWGIAFSTVLAFLLNDIFLLMYLYFKRAFKSV